MLLIQVPTRLPTVKPSSRPTRTPSQVRLQKSVPSPSGLACIPRG